MRKIITATEHAIERLLMAGTGPRWTAWKEAHA